MSRACSRTSVAGVTGCFDAGARSGRNMCDHHAMRWRSVRYTARVYVTNFTRLRGALLLVPQDTSGRLDRRRRAPGIADEDRQCQVTVDADEPAVRVGVVDVFGRAGLAEHARNVGETGGR